VQWPLARSGRELFVAIIRFDAQMAEASSLGTPYSTIIETYKPLLEGSTFYPTLVNIGDQFQWLDEIAGTGLCQNLNLAWFNWRAWRLWCEDKELYYVSMRGFFTPAL
jgi:hypothetical protein